MNPAPARLALPPSPFAQRPAGCTAQSLYKCKTPSGFAFQDKPCISDEAGGACRGLAPGHRRRASQLRRRARRRRRLVLKTDSKGIFRAQGRANREQLEWLVDTRAAACAVPASFAQKAGISCSVQTVANAANGQTPACLAQNVQLSFGPFKIVSRIAIPENLSEPLLGMSALSGFSVSREAARTQAPTAKNPPWPRSLPSSPGTLRQAKATAERILEAEYAAQAAKIPARQNAIQAAFLAAVCSPSAPKPLAGALRRRGLRIIAKFIADGGQTATAIAGKASCSTYKKKAAVGRRLFRARKDYSMIFETTPAPTVRPPSRIAKRKPSSIAIGAISFTVICTLSPGITISTPSGRDTAPVTSVVRK